MGKQKLKINPSKLKIKSKAGMKKKMLKRSKLKIKSKPGSDFKVSKKKRFSNKLDEDSGVFNGKNNFNRAFERTSKRSKNRNRNERKIVKQNSKIHSEVTANESGDEELDDLNANTQDGDDSNETQELRFVNGKVKQKVQKESANDVSQEGNDDDGKPLWGDDEDVEDLDDGNSDNYENEIESHKANLEKLKTIDPEFYKFLQENDKKLLEFNISDAEDEKDDDEEEQIHKPTSDLEVASDESDFEVNIITTRILNCAIYA